LQTLAKIVLVLALGLAIGFVILLVTGKDAVLAYTALLTGPFARLGRTGQWLEITSNLIFVGLAASMTFRAKLFNLGLSSQVLMGAMCGYVAATRTILPPVVGVIIPIVAGMLGGFALGVLPGWMKARLGASEILTTLMLGFITPLGIGFLFDVLRIGYGSLPSTSWLPRLSEVTALETGTLHAGLVLALLATLVVWLLLERTPFGYAVRTTGANATFARYGGIDVSHTITLAFGISGALAALTGTNVLMGLLRDPGVSVAGFTFDGLVVALLARNKPLAVPVAALFYAYLIVGADRMELVASVGAEMVNIVQAIVVMLIAVPALMRQSRQQTANTSVSDPSPT
jgi:simple sugar transport system permease protein